MVAPAEHLRAAVEQQVLTVPDASANVLRVTISAGVACYDHGESLGIWLNRADAALYRAKNTGRNRVVFGEGHEAVDAGGGNVVPISRAG